jgi:DNA (cytosine-5)-methyltransferase 1
MRHQVAFGFASLFPDELAIDLFAGGGGASKGIEWAIRRPVDMAINHDPIAVAMHLANHPRTRHFCKDIYEVAPRDACGSHKVGFLWASPDCTHHSQAKGGKPRNRGIRALAYVIVDWAREVRPRVIALENVKEFLKWGPLDDDGYPIKDREGEDFRAFVAALSDLGYQVEWRVLVAADYGAPTTRERIFMLARCDGEPIVWPTPTHGKGRREAWRPASAIIDWTLPARSIFGRRKPLAEATMHRIAVGLGRYVLHHAHPFIVPVTHQGGARVYDIRDPMRTVTAANRGDMALVQPVVANQEQVAAFITKHYSGVYGHGVTRPIGTVTCQDHHSLSTVRLAPVESKMAVKAPWVAKFYGTSTGSDATDPLPTVTASGWHLAEVSAFLVSYYGNGQPLDVTDPLDTVTTRDRFGLVMVRGVPHRIVDIQMRMLSPRELFDAQGFPHEYVIDIEHQGRWLTKTDQIDKAGNSVCPPVSHALVAANAGEQWAVAA